MLQHGQGGLMLAVLVPAAVLASWYDYRSHRIPNWLNAAIAAAGLTAQAAFGGWDGFVHGMAGLGVGLGCLVVLWAMKGMGAGDVKLMAAVGTWLGPRMVGYALVAGILTGGVIALAMIARRKSWSLCMANLSMAAARAGGGLGNDAGSRPSLASSPTAMPYAIPLMLGTLMVLCCELAGWVKLT